MELKKLNKHSDPHLNRVNNLLLSAESWKPSSYDYSDCGSTGREMRAIAEQLKKGQAAIKQLEEAKEFAAVLRGYWRNADGDIVNVSTRTLEDLLDTVEEKL